MLSPWGTARGYLARISVLSQGLRAGHVKGAPGAFESRRGLSGLLHPFLWQKIPWSLAAVRGRAAGYVSGAHTLT